MANEYGINVGNVLSKASDIKSSRLNVLAKKQDMENDKTDRADRLANATRQKGNVQQMASQTPGMEGYDVETTAEFNNIKKFVDNASNEEKAKALQVVQTMGKYSMAILYSEDVA